jgi:hypothetical protein
MSPEMIRFRVNSLTPGASQSIDPAVAASPQKIIKSIITNLFNMKNPKNNTSQIATVLNI